MSTQPVEEPGIASRLEASLGGRYTIERLLGQGGMATVYRAHDTRHAGRSVALKVLRPEIASGLGADRFIREIQLAARLNHPRIVPVFDSGEADGLLYYVMPFVEGESLRERIRRPPPLLASDAIRIVCEVATALQYAHEHGIVHRDVKPENIMLNGGDAVIMDFGVARALGGDDPITGVGVSVGTPGYMSPEQAVLGSDVDARSDVYSLGCVLHELLTGHTPGRLLTESDLHAGRLDADPETRVRLDGLPSGVERALVHALSPLPEQRFPTVQAFADALASASAGLAVPDTTSVAVLPFANLTGDPSTDYLGEGIAEEITNALARARWLRVASRTSAFAFRDSRHIAREIGARLGVATLLEGSVQKSEDHLRVTVRLVNADDGYQIWSERFDRPMRDIFEVQDQIAEQVAGALMVSHTDAGHRALTRVPTSDVAAYELYLQGRRYFHQTRKRSLEYARTMFERAIELDPHFALAHAASADCWSLLHMYYPSAEPALEHADTASLRALELDPDLPEAHAARGFALFQLGRHDDAAAEFETAIRLDPAQFEARYFFGRQCFQDGAMMDAIRWFEDASRVREDYQARFFAAQSYEALGRHEEAMGAYRKALEVAEAQLTLHPDDPRAATMCAVALCRLGDSERGLRWTVRALEIDPEDAGVRYNVACLYALEGQREAAIRCLQECIQLGFWNWEWIARDPDLVSLHGEPAFEALIADARPGSDARRELAASGTAV